MTTVRQKILSHRYSVFHFYSELVIRKSLCLQKFEKFSKVAELVDTHFVNLTRLNLASCVNV